ncbi:extensin-like [Benincasa hispida]|uniref:extensin-like n=1 Tax=Benincasa hispida TaxID=102211 RepID=UPI001901408A|nr:extensin-like [Benincasa hispida]
MSSTSDSQNQSISFGNDSQRPTVSKPSSAPTKASKTIVTPPAKILQPKPKTPQQKPKSAPKPRAKTPAKPRTRPSSTIASKPYTKPAPPPIIPNITMVGATHDPFPAYAHNAPSLAVHPPPSFSIEPLAIIYPVESDASSQPSPSPILISSPGMPYTPMGTPPFTPPIPPSNSPASEHNLEELTGLA